MKKQIWGEIRKVDEAEDGTITVYGIASTEAVDAAGEIIKADAIRAALPEYRKFPALREMHGLSAAGTTLEIEVDDDDVTRIVAHVVDEEAIRKVQTKTYRGFSIGGKVMERDSKNRKIITKIRLNEVSLVDRPSCPEASLEMWKADGAEEDTMDPTNGVETPEVVTPAEPVVTVPVETAPGVAPVEPEKPAESDKPAEPAAAVADATAAVEPPASPEAPAEAPADAAAKAETAPDPIARANAAVDAIEASLAKASGTGDLAKSIYSVSRFAEVLQSIYYLVREAVDEAEFEQDNSPVPLKLRAWLVTGAALFKEMAVEEVDELIARVTTQKAAEAQALSRAAEAEALTKVAAGHDELLTKVAERDEALVKLAGRVEPLAKALEELTARLAVVEDQPVPAKTAGTFAKVEATPVSKETDSAGAVTGATAPQLSEEQVSKVLAAMPDDERTFLLTKAALSRPIHVTR